VLPKSPMNFPQLEDPQRYSLVSGNHTIELVNQRTIIGRNTDLMACINDQSVSREHAYIEIYKGTAFLKQMGNKPTLINGTRVDEGVKLNHGDVL